MAQYNRNNWHHIPGIGGIMATGLSKFSADYLMKGLRNTQNPYLS